MNEMHFTGYRKAETWAELGLIGDRLSFTDDEVITKLGLGYVSSQGFECAMDTAIRYELLNAGQDGEISAKQMLNPRTKLAALIEAGIVADGWYKNDDNERERLGYMMRGSSSYTTTRLLATTTGLALTSLHLC